MPRPCTCERPECKQCRLFHEDGDRGAHYRRLWGVARADDPPATPVQQARSLARAVTRHARQGFVAASAEVQAERRALCDACEHRDAAADRCKLCRCKLSGIVNKIQMADEVCPAGKWGKPLPPIP